jgi:hypothetical protein
MEGLREPASPRRTAAARCPRAKPPLYSPRLGARKEGVTVRGVKPEPIGFCPRPTRFQGRRGSHSCDAESTGRRGKTKTCQAGAQRSCSLQPRSRDRRGRRGEQLRQNRAENPSRLTLSAAETRGNPGPQAATLRREE